MWIDNCTGINIPVFRTKGKNVCACVLPLDPFKPEFTIVIYIHYKLRIAVAILDLQWMKMT